MKIDLEELKKLTEEVMKADLTNEEIAELREFIEKIKTVEEGLNE